MQPLKQSDTEPRNIITEESIVNIGDQLRICRLLVRDKMVRLIAGGTCIRNIITVYFISNDTLRQKTVNDGGNKDRPTKEDMAAYKQIIRRKKAVMQKPKA